MSNKLKIICAIVLINLTFGCKSDQKQKKTKETEVTPKTENDISGQYKVDENSSIINWIGSKPARKHTGIIKVKSGEMSFENGKLVSGKFTIDMNSINVRDLEGQDKIDLENHLKGSIEGKEDHFFNVEEYPYAFFKITSVEPFEGKHKIKGDLEIKGITNSVEFVSEINFGNDNQAVKLISEEFSIDRTEWDIEFMSKSVFDDLKDNFINDNIQIQVNIKAIQS
ncbi:YceI family protein [Flavobacterium sp. CS20]|uniref:YceI family protein n=1 Tax=Flavobacterium sp. CS20 TaxID=2775246 RepID=UPI001B3A67B3|nr:YceI family protein [Flavobacterium sp. CS20]QTY27183.1 YceI family protein [Flavobacterium sp. CS20]